MTTLASSSLPVPEQVIVGTGSYTIPVNRYAYANLTSTVTWAGQDASNLNVNSLMSLGTSSTANKGGQWLVAGNTLSTSNSFPTDQMTYAGNVGATGGQYAYARVLINGTDNCASWAGCSSFNRGTSTSTVLRSTGAAGWSASLYRIPKGNLPSGAAEGE